MKQRLSGTSTCIALSSFRLDSRRSLNRSAIATIFTFSAASSTLAAAPVPRPPQPISPTRIGWPAAPGPVRTTGTLAGTAAAVAASDESFRNWRRDKSSVRFRDDLCFVFIVPLLISDFMAVQSGGGSLMTLVFAGLDFGLSGAKFQFVFHALRLLIGSNSHFDVAVTQRLLRTGFSAT